MRSPSTLRILKFSKSLLGYHLSRNVAGDKCVQKIRQNECNIFRSIDAIREKTLVGGVITDFPYRRPYLLFTFTQAKRLNAAKKRSLFSSKTVAKTFKADPKKCACCPRRGTSNQLCFKKWLPNRIWHSFCWSYSRTRWVNKLPVNPKTQFTASVTPGGYDFIFIIKNSEILNSNFLFSVIDINKRRCVFRAFDGFQYWNFVKSANGATVRTKK